MTKAHNPLPNIIAIGASAGGVEAISSLMRQLPADLPASVLIVLHRPPLKTSYLPEIIRRNTRMKVALANNGSPLEPGVCLISPPDRHLTVTPNLHVHLFPDGLYRAGNIDLLFHSLAKFAGPNTIGVVLSGGLCDGTLGLKAIKHAGGISLVQSPSEAPFPDMPENAIRHDGAIDLIGPVATLGEEICRRLGCTPVLAVPNPA